MKILSALDLVNGEKAKVNRMGSLLQPIAMISEKEKDEAYFGWCLDFYEFYGQRQIMRRSPKLLKYYKIARGIIDKEDYGLGENAGQAGIMDQQFVDNLRTGSKDMLELKNFPWVKTIIDSFRTEFSKRQTKIMFQAVDPISISEMEQDKTDKIEQLLLAQASFNIQQKLQEQGVDLKSKDAQQQLDPQALKQLPQLQNWYETGYRNTYVEWAQHQMAVDIRRFSMNELEERGFVDKLVTDSEFWHFKMKENDYDVELWNPLQTFYHKSPDRRWISQANWVGYIDLMSTADVVDKYGWIMTEEQLQNVESLYPIRAAGYLLDNVHPDGSYYDATRSHDWNTQMPGLAYRQFVSKYENSFGNGDIIQTLLLGSEDLQDFGNTNLMRVTTIYWKSARKVGHLTKINEQGIPEMDIVDEFYKVVNKPVYDTTIYKEKTRFNLSFGEHIDWIWINDIYGGIKIGPNRPAWWGMNNPGGMQPMYIGITKNKPGRLPFQFKGDDNLYGVKLPVEGAVFGDRNTLSVPMVAQLIPYQIGINMTGNQILDIMVDEIGTVVMFDQNALPKHSLGEDWGLNPYQQAYTAMKTFGMLPLDTSLQNIAQNGNVNFNQYHQMDLSQTQRLQSRMQLFNFFLQQGYAAIGFNAARMGQPLGQETSAKEYEESMRKSYDQTEMQFIEHCDYLMPRVHQMRTELAQYYQSKNPSVQLQYVTQNNQRVLFQIDGTKLLLRDFNIYPEVNVNARQIIKNIQQMLLTNNTTGATMPDLGSLLQIDNIADLNTKLKDIENRQQQEKQSEMQQEQQQHEAELAQEQKLKQMEWNHEDIQAEKDRQSKILIAEITSAARAATGKPPEASEGAYQNAMDKIQEQQQWREQMDFDKQKHFDSMTQAERDRQVQQQKVNAENARTHEDSMLKRKQAARKSSAGGSKK